MNERDQIVWCAGFFDGEGCVSLVRQTPKRYRRVHKTYTISVAVSQKHPEPLQVFKKLFGGHLYPYQSYGVTYWRWCAGRKESIAMLEKLLPYLLVKREITDLVLRFNSMMNGWLQGKARYIGYSEEVREAREQMYLQSRVINARNRANHKAPKYLGPPRETKVESGEKVTVQ